jgi:hypothetical protein
MSGEKLEAVSTIYLVYRSSDKDFADQVEQDLARKGIDVIRYDQQVAGNSITNFNDWAQRCWHVLLLVSNEWSGKSKTMEGEINVLALHKESRVDQYVYAIYRDDKLLHDVLTSVIFFGNVDRYTPENMVKLSLKFRNRPQYK